MDDTTPISITQLEQAINYWRLRSPSTGDEARLCEEAAALATPYALLIFAGTRELHVGDLNDESRQAYAGWLEAERPRSEEARTLNL